jgi:hypothetical protein
MRSFPPRHCDRLQGTIGSSRVSHARRFCFRRRMRQSELDRAGRSRLVRCRRARMDPRHFRPHLYAGATPVVVWRSLAGCFIGRSDPDRRIPR